MNFEELYFYCVSKKIMKNVTLALSYLLFKVCVDESVTQLDFINIIQMDFKKT